MLEDRVKKYIDKLNGKIGIYFKDMLDGTEYGINEDERFISASVIKIPVLIEAFNQHEKGMIDLNDRVKVTVEDRVPSCGAVAYMHDGIQVTLRDLCNLMIIISDNTATNILVKKLGIDNINNTLEFYGIKNTRIQRLLFDDIAEQEGKRNYFSPRDIGILLMKMWNRDIISKKSSEEMIEILKQQQLNNKIPYLLPEDTIVAHKTGEDSGITHDVGIICSSKPFIFCFASNDTYVPDADTAIQKIALEFFNR